jgi:two-component system cell cycle response regulator DivK
LTHWRARAFWNHQVNEALPDLDPDLVRGTVLCIEDHPLNMALVEGLLAPFKGVTLLKAMNGQEGVQLARSAQPDLILLDMNLPDISGLDVVRLLCEEISRQTLSVVLVTAESFSMEVVKAMSLGAREYWMKPLSLEKLRKDLPRALRRAQADRERAERA